MKSSESRERDSLPESHVPKVDTVDSHRRKDRRWQTRIARSHILRTTLFASSVVCLVIPDILFQSDSIPHPLAVLGRVFLLLSLLLAVLWATKSLFWAYLIVGIPYVLSSSIEITNVSILSSFIEAEGLQALRYTTSGEIEEFIGGFRSYVLMSFVVIAIYAYFLYRYRSISLVIKNRTTLILLASLCLLLSCMISTAGVVNSSLYYSGQNLLWMGLKRYYIQRHPFNLYYQIRAVAKSDYQIYRFKEAKESYRFGVQRTIDATSPKIVVFVIGERIRYGNWSLNGYARETSPNLDKIENLISFDEHYSNGNVTYTSIPLMITQATPQTYGEIYAQKTIIPLFKEAGYETHWISNQNVFEYLGNEKESDFTYELFRTRAGDIGLIPAFDSVVRNNPSRNKLIVINMVGGHGRVPSRFRVFSPNSGDGYTPVSRENAPILVNDYDNMILLQDYVLSELIHLTDKQGVSAVLLFAPDHGSNLFDDGTNLFAYGSAHPTEKETHIPLFIWGSHDFVEGNEKFSNLRNHKNLLTTNNDIFSTLADLANIQYESFVRQKSIADSSYVEPSSRFVYVHNEVMEFKR